MLLPWRLALTVTLVALQGVLLDSGSAGAGVAVAQYTQDVSWTVKNGRVVAQWRPDTSSPLREVIDFKSDAVVLEYNCAFMKEICKNVDDWYNTAAGRGYTGLPFVYDFNTGRKGRSAKRRRKVCPTGKRGWRSWHSCPQSGQDLPMRHDGAWFTTLLEPNTTVNGLMNARDPTGRITEYSNIRYSCDEFPPATWVQGGKGVWSESTTRCAAIRCGKGVTAVVKAEQDWQGTAHGQLRVAIEDLVEQYQSQHHQFLNFNPKQDAAFFTLRRITDPTSTAAAKVYTYNGPFTTGQVSNTKAISVAKRQFASHEFHEFLSRASVHKWKALGTVREYPISVNDTVGISHFVAHYRDYDSLGVSTVSRNNVTDETESSFGAEEDDAVEYDDNEEKYAEYFRQNRVPSHNFNQISAYSITPSTQEKNEPSKKKHWELLRSLATTFRSVVTSSFRRLPNASEPEVDMARTPGVKLPVVNNSSATELDKARALVESAIAKSIKLNMARYAKPAKSNYRHGKIAAEKRRRRDSADQVSPLLKITDVIAEAAALVSEADALHLTANLTARSAASGSYWMGSITRKGTVPWGGDDKYKVFRNVRDYGAKGDGTTDDTKAIKDALNDGKRCGEKCNGSTTKNAIVYFPPGKYRISSSIPLPFGTQVIGDANDWPVLVAAKNFVGLGVLSTDEYTGGGTGIDGGDEEWFVNTANFYRQIRNIRIDITATRPALGVAGLHYQVAQATSLQDVEIIASRGTKQRGIFAENGSGGVIADVTFRGSGFGIYGGTQQFTAQRLAFFDCDVGVQVIWDWGWVWKSITMTHVGTGFKLLQEGAKSAKRALKRDDGAGVSGNIGSVSVTDSYFNDVDTAILIAPPNPEPGSGSTGVIVENVRFRDVSRAVADTSGKVLLSPSSTVGHWALGPVYSAAGNRTFSNGGSFATFQRQRNLLDSAGNYFERAKPQYADCTASDFVHVKDFGAKGDGVTDDTKAVQSALYGSQGKILFVDAGSYILTSTVTIPPGCKIVGETWSQLVAKGSFFNDGSKPQPLIKVANEGDIGDVEMQDLIFTSVGSTAGLVVVEWNIQSREAGSAGLWDCHVRLGGATGTELTPTECPPVRSGVNSGCFAASLMMHITSTASGYFENMWLWVADHMIDDPDLNDSKNDMIQTSVYVARGLLIESKAPTWLYGTASEHAVFYQYNFHEALNIYAGMLQTESPYYQPTPKPPAPFTSSIGTLPGDPSYDCKGNGDFSGCDASWAVIMRKSGSIFVAGAGLYSWFSTYSQDCIDSQSCQKSLVLLEENHSNVRFQNLVTIGAKYMAVQDGQGISARDNLNVKSHPAWSQISVLDVSSSKSSGDFIWISPEMWDMDEPRFTCSQPCTVVLPAWTKASTIIDVPIMTVTQDGWTSEITEAPITVAHWMFEIVTLQQDLGARDNAATTTAFWPKPSKRAHWPSAQYVDPQGNTKFASPTATFPKPPSSLGPDTPKPPLGFWPQRAVVAEYGSMPAPVAQFCPFFMPDTVEFCEASPWIFPSLPGGSNDPFDETDVDDDVYCPAATTTTTELPTSQPTPTPKRGNPRLNSGSCISKGRSTTHNRVDEAIKQFCNGIGSPGKLLLPGYEYIDQKDSHASNEVGGTRIKMQLEVFSSCEWKYDYDECWHYLHAPVDGCDCKGVDGKHGGNVLNDCYRWDINVTRYWEW